MPALKVDLSNTLEKIPLKMLVPTALQMLAAMAAIKAVGATSGVNGLLSYSSALNFISIGLALCSLGSETGLIRLGHDTAEPRAQGLAPILFVGLIGAVLLCGVVSLAVSMLPELTQLRNAAFALPFLGIVVMYARVTLLRAERGEAVVVCQAAVLSIVVAIVFILQPASTEEFLLVMNTSYAIVFLPISIALFLPQASQMLLAGADICPRVYASYRRFVSFALPRLAGFSLVSLSSVVLVQASELMMRNLAVDAGNAELFAKSEAYIRINTLWMGFLGIILSSFFLPKYSRSLGASQVVEQLGEIRSTVKFCCFSFIAYLPVGILIFKITYSDVFRFETGPWLFFSTLFITRGVGSIFSLVNFVHGRFIVVFLGEVMLSLVPVATLALILDTGRELSMPLIAITFALGISNYAMLQIIRFWLSGHRRSSNDVT